jgi:hypothetical protein
VPAWYQLSMRYLASVLNLFHRHLLKFRSAGDVLTETFVGGLKDETSALYFQFRGVA